MAHRALILFTLLGSSLALHSQAPAPAASALPQKLTLAPAADVLRSYTGLKANILKAADKMPAESYPFRPTPRSEDLRPASSTTSPKPSFTAAEPSMAPPPPISPRCHQKQPIKPQSSLHCRPPSLSATKPCNRSLKLTCSRPTPSAPPPAPASASPGPLSLMTTSNTPRWPSTCASKASSRPAVRSRTSPPAGF